MHLTSHPLARALASFYAKVQVEENGCWRWLGAYSEKRSGHRPVIWIGGNRENGGKCMIAARFILLCCAYKPPSARLGLEACHSCDHDWCVHPRHLAWGTRSENGQDYFDKFGRKGDKARAARRAHPGEGTGDGIT